MRDGKCTKCGSESVHRRGRSLLQIHPLLQIGVFQRVCLTPCVCVACGYTEFYVAGKSDRTTIAEKWPKVEPKHSSSESS
jgi:predicted nucleic-acid-binding Zn-ribbon protein